jgi:hypothetical protein
MAHQTLTPAQPPGFKARRIAERPPPVREELQPLLAHHDVEGPVGYLQPIGGALEIRDRSRPFQRRLRRRHRQHGGAEIARRAGGHVEDGTVMASRPAEANDMLHFSLAPMSISSRVAVTAILLHTAAKITGRSMVMAASGEKFSV